MSSGTISPSTFTLPDNSANGLYCLPAFLIFAACACGCAYSAIRTHDLILLVAVVPLALASYLSLRAMLISTPSSIRITSDSVVISDVPSLFIWLNDALVPVVIRKEVTISINDFSLEWIGNHLTWNDIQCGKSVYLANSVAAKPLITWFNDHGISSPPKPV